MELGGGASEGRAVMVTGCSSGIGRAVALHLARHDFVVLATVRHEEQAAELEQENDNVIAVHPLDLSKPVEVAAAAKMVKRILQERGLPGLYAVVSNAGGGSIAPLELLDVSVLRRELEVRVVAPLALLQSLLPLIRAAKGRVLWIVTPGLIPIPFVGSIHVPDFAANCLARTLRLELGPWDVPVVMVRCGGIKTAAIARTAEELKEQLGRWPAGRAQLYAAALRRELDELAEFDRKRSEPEVVARVVHRALIASRPRTRYTVGYMGRAAALADLLPQALVDKVMAWRG